MKKRKVFFIILCFFVVLGCVLSFNKNEDIKNQALIDKVNLENVDYLMIVAHPDDETIWGGSHLLEGRYLVVCLTNRNNQTRKKEFMGIIEATHNQGLILDYPDKTNGKRDNWYKVKDDIKKDIAYILQKKNWQMIVTHNPNGEYGHIHHQMTSAIVTKQDHMNKDKLMYFGKYYKKKKKPKHLQQIKASDLTQKMELVNHYGSQHQVMDHLGHMLNHENWVKAKDWR